MKARQVLLLLTPVSISLMNKCTLFNKLQLIESFPFLILATTATTSTTTTTSTTEELAPLREPLDLEAPVEKWYADFPNAADGVINCIYGSFYDTPSVFDTQEECCAIYPCRHEEYWYPAVYHDLRIVVCEYGSDYPEDYWQQPR